MTEQCSKCKYCSPPDLDEINLDVWEIWLEIQTQWRTSGFGIVGLDYSEVRQAAKRFEIELSTRNWKKIKALERTQLQNVNASKSSDNKSDRGND